MSKRTYVVLVIYMRENIRSILVVWIILMLVLSTSAILVSSGSSSIYSEDRDVNESERNSGRARGREIDPPVDIPEKADAFLNRAENAASGAATFLKVEGYEPWAALVINAGDPEGVDEVTVSFEDDTLIIEATDDNDTNHVTILMNKAFADEYLADAEDDLEIETSDAVNYEGLDNSNASAGGRAMYVFHIRHFSTQTIEVSSADSLPFIGPPMLLLAIAVPIAYYACKRKIE